MNFPDLQIEMQKHKIQVSLTADGKVRLQAPTPPPPALLEAIRANRGILQGGLLGSTSLMPLPEPLKRIVLAAVSPGIPSAATLPAGQVMNLGDFVLACAALYAAGVEPERQLEHLRQAQKHWSR